MFDSEIASASIRYQVPKTWIQAVIETESAWNPTAYRAEPRINDASYGLMQLLYKTAEGLGYRGAPEGLYNPAVNINLGTKLLGELRQKYGDDFQRVYSAYNSGRPDLYKTSSQVAANVARAVENLAKWIEASIGEFVQSPVQSTLPALLFVTLMLFWAGKRR